MAKVGTAHLEIKPVLNEAALDVIADKIQEAVERGVRAALGERRTEQVFNVTVNDYDDFLRQLKLRNRASVTLPKSPDNPIK